MFAFSVLDICKVFQKIYFVFWCYMIDLWAAYLQRLEASGFSCLYIKKPHAF